MISWLLQGDRELTGIPFPEVIEASTGKKIVPVDAVKDAPWLGRLRSALDQVLRELNSPSHPIHKAPRINEASRFIEDALRAALDSEPGWRCSIPRTSGGAEQRSGYPDLQLDMGRDGVVYLDPKLYEVESRDSTLRTFYFEPKAATGKIHSDGRHLLVAVSHNGKTGADLRMLGWKLVDASRIKVRLKAEFQASNHAMYRSENIVLESPADP